MANIYDQFDPGGASASQPAAAPPAPVPGPAFVGPGAPKWVPDMNNPPAYETPREPSTTAPSGGNIYDQFDVPSARAGKGDTVSGIARNVAAAPYEALTSLAGAPVDAITWLRRQQATAFGTWTPEEAIKYGADPALFNGATQVGGSHSLNKALGYIGANPEDVLANGPWERAARSAGVAAASMLLPAGPAARALEVTAPRVAAGAAEPATLGQATLDMLRSGSKPSVVAAGAAGGAAGQEATEFVPDEYKPVVNVLGNLAGAGGVAGATELGGRVLGGARSTASNFVAPFTETGRQRLAGEKILGASSEPSTLAGKLDVDQPELVPGSQPTTYQLTGDQGIGNLERASAAKNSDAFLTRRAQQNAARTSAIEGLAPEGANSAAVGDYFRGVLSDMDARNDAALDSARGNVRSAVQSTGATLPLNEYGPAMRGELADANNQAKASERALWSAIDPENRLALDVTPTKQAATKVVGNISDSAKPPQGEEAAIYGLLQQYPATQRLGEFTDLRGRLLQAIRDERRASGESPALYRMTQLRQAMDNNLASAVEAQATTEANNPSVAGQAGSIGSRLLNYADQTGSGAPAPQVGSSVFTPSGRQINVRYEVVPAESLITSHNPDLTPNPAYPPELQPRDRARAASETQIANMSGNLQPERLGPSASAAEGAPIVGPDHLVESGNARTLAIRTAYQQGSPAAKAYRAYLDSLGADTTGIKNPVLIRRRVADLSPAERIRFAQEANAPAGLSLSAAERARVDAGRISPNILELYRSGEVGGAENRDFVRAFVRTVPERGEEGGLVTGEGTLSLEGERRIRNALLAKAYGDPGLIGALADTGDENIRAFGNALTNTSGSIAQLNAEIAAGRVPERFDVTKPLTEAARIVQKARARGQSLPDAVAQLDAFNSVSPTAEQILRVAYGDDLRGRLSQARFTDQLQHYVEHAAGQSTEAQLFANNVTAGDILAAGVRRYGTGNEAASAGIAPGRPGAVGQINRVGGQEIHGSDVGPARAPNSKAGAGNARVLPEVPKAPLTANFDQEGLSRYRAAADATRERKAMFGTGPVGAVLRSGPLAGSYRLTDSQVAAKFFTPGPRGAENVIAYLRAVGNRGEAADLLEGYAAASLGKAALNGDGTIDRAAMGRWLQQHDSALNVLPELRQKFDGLQSAQDTLIRTAADAKAARLQFERSQARHFIGSDPVDAVASVLRSGDREQKFRELVGMVSGDTDARAGLQRALVEYINRNLKGTAEAGDTGQTLIKSDAFQKWAGRNKAALRQLFTSDQIEAISSVAADLRRANRSIAGSKLPGGSNTPQDVAAMEKHGGKSSFLGTLLAAEAGGAILEGATGGHSAILRGAGIAGTALMNAVRSSGLRKVDDLVSEAMLHPPLARELIAKVPTNPPPPRYLRRLAHQILLAAGVSGVSGTYNQQEH
jgi:hypothetical protein